MVGPQVGMQKVSEYQQNAAECRPKAAKNHLKLTMLLEEMEFGRGSPVGVGRVSLRTIPIKY
jgi:hypothetical protein